MLILDEAPSNRPDADEWKEGVDGEMENLKSHDVYELVPRTNDMRTLKLGWALHQKFKIGLFERNKGRPLARGNHQCPDIDYGELFSPVVHLESFTSMSSSSTSLRPTYTVPSRRRFTWSNQRVTSLLGRKIRYGALRTAYMG